MNGREFLDEIIQRTDIHPLPIIVVSATGTQASKKGTQKWLKKPVDIDDLLRVVEKYCIRS